MMKVTLTGEDAYGVRAELAKLTAAFIDAQGDMALERLDGAEAGYGRLRESLQSVPFLSERKMVVLQNAGANKQFAEHAEELLRGLPGTTDVVIVEPKPDRRAGYYKILKKLTELREFGVPDAQGLADWLVAAAKEKGGKLSPADARFLVERVGQDRLLLASELEKLLLYDPNITHQTIELLTEPTPQGSIFELLEAAFTGHVPRAIELYRGQREQKVDPSRIIAMLTWQLWVLAVIKAARRRSVEEIAREAKLNPYVARRSQIIADRLAMAELQRLVTELLTIDARSKREGIDLDEALQAFLLTLAP